MDAQILINFEFYYFRKKCILLSGGEIIWRNNIKNNVAWEN